MSVREGNVVCHGHAGIRVDFHNENCSSCPSGCSQKPVTTIALPCDPPGHWAGESLQTGSRVEISMSLRSQAWLLLNSLLLPLVGFVSGAVIADQLTSNESIILVSSVFGMGIGIVLCRKFPDRLIRIKEVV